MKIAIAGTGYAGISNAIVLVHDICREMPEREA